MNRILLLSGILLLMACRDAKDPVGPSGLMKPAVRNTTLGIIPRPGHHIVIFKNSVANPSELTRNLVSAHRGSLEHTFNFALKGFSAELSDSAIAVIRSHKDVAQVELDSYMTATAVITQAGATWGIDRLDQRDLPLSNSYSYATTGAGVNVYIIDTGIWTTHAEFSGRASSVFDAIGDGNGNTDCDGHGTHVAGTVGGSTYGVAKQVRLYSVRVLGCDGSGSTSGVIAGVDWVTGNRVLPAVANMSLGGSPSSALDQAVRNSIASGVTYAIAAGNSNVDACTVSPARVTEALVVGATSINDARASFSNFGTCVDIFAPGVGITSSFGGSNTATRTLDGTSMASPHIAGAAARYLEANPAASPSAVATALTGNATPNKVSTPGSGSPNLLVYTAFMDGPPPAANQPPVARFSYSCTGTSCRFDATSSTDDVGITSYSWDLGKYPDGTATGAVVTTTYPHSGQRTVTLTVRDGAGATNSVTQTLTVGANQPPVAAFTFSCTNLTCSFNSSGSSDDVGITNRAWTFGDGGTAGNVVSTSRTYATAGTYDVTLTVTDGGGLTNSVTKQVTVTAPPPNQAPVARFTWSCSGLTCTMDGTSSTDDGGIVAYTWDLGKYPGGAASGSVVTTTYAHSGPRTVTLTVRDAAGLTNSVTQTITIP